ncbi:HNH endonuclease signature motif containing protein [Actinomyces naeslundii]|uniref:HNH endonuclease signature motif containing protein n=1 Tax=Actinomyces naeslundii TaxID=1655 RepID=UPI0035A048EB
MFPGVLAGGAVGVLGAPGGVAASVPAVSVEDAAGLLASLAAGGVLAGVVEGLLACLLVTVQDSGDEGSDAEGSGADGAGGAGSVGGGGLFGGEPGGDAAVVAVVEGFRVVGVEEAGSSGLLGLGAVGLGELAAVCHRLAAWATWGESLAAACLTGCGELSARPGRWGPGGQVSPVVGFEERRFNTACLLSARLGVSRARAGQIVDHGGALMSAGLSPTEAMERCGVLDSVKASLVTRRLEGVPVPVALAVQDQVLPQAPRRSVSQVGWDIERALIEVDPDGHTERTRATVSRRCVSRPRPVGEGLCQVLLLLPTMDALLLDATLDAIAASVRAAGERRTPGQLGADAVTAMTLQTLRTSQMAAYQPTPRQVEHCGEDPAETNQSPAPGRLLPDGVPLDGLLGALSGLVGSASEWWTPSGTGHLPLPRNIHIDVQVTVPITSLAPPADPAGSGDPGDGDRADDGPDSLDTGRTSPNGGRRATVLEPFDRESSGTSGRSLPSSGGRSLPAPGQGAPTAQTAAAAETAEVRIGARSAVVPAMTGWALAAGGTWRRLVTDPTSRTAVDVGRTSYRPPTGLADLVRARDRSCVFPACQAPASRCDLDHLTAWGQGRTTSLNNLATLYQAHHHLKHTPDRTVYQRHPDGTINRLPRKTGPHRTHVPSTLVPTDLSKQTTPEIINHLNTTLNHTHPSSGSTRPITHGPHPHKRPGHHETTPYPRATHTLKPAPPTNPTPPFRSTRCHGQ